MSVYYEARKKTAKKIQAAFWQLYEKKPINKITVAQVSKLAGIHRSTFYIHFADVYQILEIIEQELLTQIQDSDVTNADSLTGLTIIGKRLFNAVRSNYQYLHLLLIEQKDAEFARQYRRYFQDKMVALIQLPSANNTSEQEMAKQLVAKLLVETFITCAGTPQMTFAATEKFMRSSMQNGYYRTLENTFALTDLIKPKK